MFLKAFVKAEFESVILVSTRQSIYIHPFVCRFLKTLLFGLFNLFLCGCYEISLSVFCIPPRSVYFKFCFTVRLPFLNEISLRGTLFGRLSFSFPTLSDACHAGYTEISGPLCLILYVTVRGQHRKTFRKPCSLPCSSSEKRERKNK